MDVVTGIVAGWMTIPSVVELTVVVLLVVVEREIPVFEPHHCKTSELNAFGIETPIIYTHQTIWSEFRVFIYSGEPFVSCKSIVNNVESVEINRPTGASIGRFVFVAAGHTVE